MDGIGLCPSAPHRAVLGLVRVAAGGAVPPTLVEDLRASAPDDLVAISFDAYVHVIVASAFDRHAVLADAVPDDLVIFFREMQAANTRRNAAIRSQLETIGAVFADAGLRGVALKGAAELLAPVFPDPSFRFLSDIDILVAEEHLGEAAECLETLGAFSDTEDDPTDYLDHHHAAPLHRKGWIAQIELHQAIGANETDRLMLPAQDVLAAAIPSPVPGLDVPGPSHRVAHAVLHAQIQTPRHREGTLSVRDVLEFEHFARGFPEGDIRSAREIFGAAVDPAAWQSLEAARDLILGTGESSGPGSEAAHAWAKNAVVLFGRPRRRRIMSVLHTLARYGSEMLFDPQRRRHHLRQLTSPGRLRKILSHQRKLFRRIR